MRKTSLRPLALLLIVLLSILALPAQARRVALVIGNEKYKAENHLSNPVQDARLISRVLKDDLHFDEVRTLENATREQLALALVQFADLARGANAAVVYYSGHGMMNDQRRNFLLPVDIPKVQSDAILKVSAISEQDVLDAVEGAEVKLVILDACRSASTGRKGGAKGLSRTDPGFSGTLIAYATAEGKTADDGDSVNSPYASALAKRLKGAGKTPVLAMLDGVKADVSSATHGAQVPTRSGDMDVSTFLVAPTASAPPPIAPPGTNSVAASARSDAQIEDQFWDTIKDSTDAGEFEGYLQQYPKGRYAAVAKAKIRVFGTRLAQAETTGSGLSGSGQVTQGGSGAGGTGSVFKDCADCPEMVPIRSGSFEMGSSASEASRDNDEGPVHTVWVGAFALGKYAVTQGEWRAVMGSNPSGFKDCGDSCPVEQVSWNDAQEYVQKLSAKTGKTYRLPSEAEWEYACRAGAHERYCGSENVDAVAWYRGNSERKTHQVGQKQANAWGLYDMSGNVWQWLQDCWHGNYEGAPSDGQVWAGGDCGYRALRGGSWFHLPQYVRAANRFRITPDLRFSSFGFRVARTLP
jgi:formylglycine-generating enzyme required for sulfatase activity